MIKYEFYQCVVGLWTIRLSAGTGPHIEYCSCLYMTIPNVIIKTPDRYCDWGVNDVIPGSDDFGDFWKKQLRFDFWLWARPVQPGATGCAARLLGQRVEISTQGRAVHLGVGCGRCRNSQHSKNCVSLSSCRKIKLKKLINVSYLNYGESAVFRNFSASVYFTYVVPSISFQTYFVQGFKIIGDS